MNYTINISRKERIFLDSSIKIGLFSGEDDAEKILGIASSLASKYKLLPNDALIAATCKDYEINKIATFDPDFKRVDFLEVITTKGGILKVSILIL